jgi:hypothetical protein
MKRSDLYQKKQYTLEELCSGSWIASRGFDVFEKADEYKAQVIERLHRAAGALHSSGIPYAVVGGNCVATWVASVDPGAIRSTKDVNILLRREDLHSCIEALEGVGFLYRHVAGLDFFVDGPAGNVRTGVHLLFAGEKVLPDHVLPAPDITEIEMSSRGFYVTTLDAIVRMKLTSHRLKDRVHLQDMLSVGLIDESWVHNLPVKLAERLQHLLDNPEE